MGGGYDDIEKQDYDDVEVGYILPMDRPNVELPNENILEDIEEQAGGLLPDEIENEEHMEDTLSRISEDIEDKQGTN